MDNDRTIKHHRQTKNTKVHSHLLALLVCLALIGIAIWITSTPVSAGSDLVISHPVNLTTGQGTDVALSSTSALTATTSTLSGSLNVFAAASLVESFTELGDQFEVANPEVEVVFAFAGSQQLAQQIGLGAPADVFASANTKQMGIAIESGRIVSETQQMFARNRLVAVYPADNPGHLATLQDLAKPGLRLVLAAKEVPVGQYTLDFLDKASLDPAFGPDFKSDVLNNVVSYEQTVKAVFSKVVLGEADGGVVYSTDAATDKLGTTVSLEISDDLNSIATYPIAVLNDSEQPELAQAFVDFALSATGQEILASYGFVAPEQSSEQ